MVNYSQFIEMDRDSTLSIFINFDEITLKYCIKHFIKIINTNNKYATNPNYYLLLIFIDFLIKSNNPL